MSAQVLDAPPPQPIEPSPALLRADARALPLPDASVDLVVTSPPYFGLRDYGDPSQIGAEPSPREFIDTLVACTREMVRVLKPTGSLFVNLGDSYASAERGPDGRSTGLTNGAQQRPGRGRTPKRCGVPRKSLMLLPERYRIAAVDELGLIARAVLVWEKPNGMPESVTDRVRRCHEDWVHLTRRPRYYAELDGLREPSSGYQRANATRDTPGGQRRRAMADTCNPLGRVPGSVWEVPTQPLAVPDALDVDHYAAFPMEWPRRLITGWCPPGGTVLDPFGGTGTTALVATMLGRHGISVDLSADYQRIAQWRSADPKQRGRAAGLSAAQVSALPVQLAGQLDLLAGGAR
jgi:DNA modification methylase